MANAKDIIWFKTQFADIIDSAVQGTVFDVDMLTAIACQESGELWGTMRRDPNLTTEQIVALCCGDTLDADKGRSAFPRTKNDLVAVPNGQRMFEIARQAAVAMAARVPGYGFVNSRPNKFCHGYGVFQYDLQFFLSNPTYFLERRYERFENTLGRALEELKRGLRVLGLQNRTAITDREFCHVAICYNTGGFKPERGLKQGHSSDGKFYGEFIRDYLAMCRTVAAPGSLPLVTPVANGTPVPDGGSVSASGPAFRVETSTTSLRLRKEAKISNPNSANVLAELPDGLVVRSFTGAPVNGFIELETTLGGKLFHGFASAQFLVKLSDAVANRTEAEVANAATLANVPPANLAHAAGAVTKRTALAGAHSLNEAGMPRRSGATPDELRSDIGEIIAYLQPERDSHKRYLPRDGLTFCNIYAHDYGTLAGAYLPRVWWNSPTLVRIAAGEVVAAKLGLTVDEVRANGLFRWLRDFGGAFGWRRASSLDELQDHANLGGVATIVARRKEDGKSGHIVMVVPETFAQTAQRNASGKVVMPLQSQAGAVNFSYGRSSLNWWTDPRFAEFSFWIHS